MISALVPAKALDQAKGRLAGMLDEEQRRRLALAMLEDVVSSLQEVAALASVIVVSPDRTVLDHATRLNATALAEPHSVRGINQALAHALASLDAGSEAVLAVLADVPAVTSSDITSVIEAGPERGVVICPSSARGTSALFLRPPDVIPFRFGQQSFQAHKREAAARRIEARIVRLESLEHDIDEPEDLAWLMDRPGDSATHRLLREILPANPPVRA
jgi:2-phospho-L-lactate guanylyltransferase